MAQLFQMRCQKRRVAL